MAGEPHIETVEDVLRNALEVYGRHEGPTPREVLEIHIRSMCASAGLPKPDFGHWPPSGLHADYFSKLAER